MVRQIRKRKERFAPISQRQLRESKEVEEEEVSRVENVCCSTSNNSDMSARKRRRDEVSDSIREEGENSVEENGATPRKQRKYDSAAETGHSAAQQRGKKRKYTEETECESPVVKKRTVQSSSEEDPETTRKQSRYYPARETGHNSAEERSSRKRTFPEETECESPVVKKRTVQSSSEEDGETLSRYYTARETVQDATEQRGKKRKSTEEPECESPVMKKGRTDKAGVSGATSTHSTKRKERETASPGVEDFIFHKILGEGAFGKVVLATHRDSGLLVAVKIVHKREIIVENPDRVLNERIAMEKAGGSPFCAHAYATFQTENYLFYVMEYMRGGDLSEIDEVLGITDDRYTMDLPTVKLVAAELVCGLQYLHPRGIVHRDMKTENVLVDSTGHVHIADFGMAALNVFGYNMVTEYFGHMFNGAPEMLFELPYDGAVDYFALGVLLFRIAFGRFAFEGIFTTSRGIKYGLPCFPDDPAPDPALKDLLEKLLCKDPCRRNDFIADIQDHPFFNGINWKELEAGEGPSPFFIPWKGFRDFTRDIIKPEDLMNNIDCYEEPIEPSISAEEQKMFDGFSFVSDTWKAMKKLK